MMPPGAIAMLTVKFRSKNRIRFLCGSGLYVTVYRSGGKACLPLVAAQAVCSFGY